ncbi:MAG: hypothetical protein QGH82_03720 [Candidatus Woesearchaeota archaeon]|jgi:hypothetical protein|nr:hypothetical protein [Candidatus Woesearchaeota archaeon]
MAKELESQSRKETSEDPWHSEGGDPWRKTNESLKVSDPPVSDGGTEKVPTPLQTEEETEVTEERRSESHGWSSSWVISRRQTRRR